MTLSAVSVSEDPLVQARIELAAVHRLAARFGFNDGIWNHFSLKAPGRPGHYLVKAHGLLCNEVTAGNLIIVDADGNTVEGRGEAERSGVCIHSPIHTTKADAACILHAHPRYATWLSNVEGGRLLPVHQNSLRFYGCVSYDDDYGGLAHEVDEGRRMAALFGDNNILLLASHGVIVTGATVAEAFYDFYYFELSCKEQYTLVSSGAQPRLIPQDLATHTLQLLQDENAASAALYFAALQRRLDREEPDYRD